MAAPAAFRRRRGAGHAVSERDSKRIIRQWDREIEDEVRRERARGGGEQPWRIVVWGALWLLWLTLLAALIVYVKAFR
jgi:hypothetical protein